MEGNHLDPAGRRIGTVLDGKWKLDSILGVGGMAAVYAATHRNGARAAIKLFPFSVTTSVEFAERILREGYLANKIGHPAVVRVLDDHLDREAEYAYLVMELLEGETARQRVERTGPMSPMEAARSMVELVNCLAVAHEKGVIHRDIKPENLFLTDDGRLKVLDFGVARALDGTSSSVTRTGAMLGTPAYMSPEQARGRPSEVSARSDLYSAGATLLFLVAGEFLHEGESAQEIMVRAAWTPAKKINERSLGLPRSIVDVIDRACAFDAAERFQTAAEMRAALESAISELAQDPNSSEPVVRVAKRTMRGPISTAPLPLSTPRDSGETIAESAIGPAEGATITVASWKARRRVLVVAGSAAVTFLITLLVFWLHSGADKAKAEPAGGEAPTAIAPSPPPRPTAARPTADQVPVETAPTVPPPSPAATAPSATKPHPVLVHHAEAPHPTAPKTPAKPAPASDSTASHTAAASKPSTLGRDLGY
ncbi:MAG TPA: serine/threonine-protein kinase [Polyangiaceae bacterium]|nr:serine/threonine-protein kinase [Polyangiaceae bacterium]